MKYDITVIPPAKLGKEYVKTAEHYHLKAPKADVSYTEIYQVLEGSAIYLLQKVGRKGRVLDVVWSRLKRGILSLSHLITGILRAYYGQQVRKSFKDGTGSAEISRRSMSL